MLEEIIEIAAACGITEKDIASAASVDLGRLRYNTKPNNLGYQIFLDQCISNKRYSISLERIIPIGNLIPVDITVSYGKEAAEGSIAYAKFDFESRETKQDCSVIKHRCELRINHPLAIDAIGVNEHMRYDEFLRKMFEHYARHLR